MGKRLVSCFLTHGVVSLTAIMIIVMMMIIVIVRAHRHQARGAEYGLFLRTCRRSVVCDSVDLDRVRCKHG